MTARHSAGCAQAVRELGARGGVGEIVKVDWWQRRRRRSLGVIVLVVSALIKCVCRIWWFLWMISLAVVVVVIVLRKKKILSSILSLSLFFSRLLFCHALRRLNALARTWSLCSALVSELQSRLDWVGASACFLSFSSSVFSYPARWQ